MLPGTTKLNSFTHRFRAISAPVRTLDVYKKYTRIPSQKKFLLLKVFFFLWMSQTYSSDICVTKTLAMSFQDSLYGTRTFGILLSLMWRSELSYLPSYLGWPFWNIYIYILQVHTMNIFFFSCYSPRYGHDNDFRLFFKSSIGSSITFLLWLLLLFNLHHQ